MGTGEGRFTGVGLARRGRVVRLGRSEGVDLRRTMCRAEADRILDRASHLRAEDHELLRAVIESGQSLGSMAALTGEPISRVRRRVHRLLERINSPLFAFVVTRAESMAPLQRRVAMACIVEGRTIREVAGTLEISFHRARTLLLTTRLECEAFQRVRRGVRATGNAGSVAGVGEARDVEDAGGSEAAA